MKTHIEGAVIAAAVACTISQVEAFTTSFSGKLGKRVAATPRAWATRLSMSAPPARVYIPLELEGELDPEKEWDIEMELNGDVQVFRVKEGTSVLEAAKVVYDDPPHSCQQGVCTTCAGLIRSGVEGIDYKVAVDALNSSQKDEGFTLTCQTFPCGPGLKVLLNQYDRVYEEQYGQYELKEKRKGFMGMF